LGTDKGDQQAGGQLCQLDLGSSSFRNNGGAESGINRAQMDLERLGSLPHSSLMHDPRSPLARISTNRNICARQPTQ